jgi:glycosyltransferase involved in cell wall biosynthesis
MAWWVTVAGVDYSFGTLLRDSDSFIVLSRIHGDWLAEHFSAAWQKMLLVPPPPILKMSKEDGTVTRERERKRLHLTAEQFVFVYFGYVYPGKGVETLLNAFRTVCQKYTNARLLILGGTIARAFPDRPGYAEEISGLPKKLAIDDKVIWLGQYDWDSDEASTCLRAVDACVVPVNGGVQLNNSSFAAAVAHALPVIATRGTTLEDAFVHRENVMLCPPKDERGLAEAMETLISDPDLACRLKNGARDMAAEWFSWSKAIDRTVEAAKAGARES